MPQRSVNTPAETTPGTEHLVTRRTVLAVGVAAAGTAGLAALAGCAKTTSASAATGPAVLAKVADIPVGNAVSATLNGKPILISQPASGQIVAFTRDLHASGLHGGACGQRVPVPLPRLGVQRGDRRSDPGSGAGSARRDPRQGRVRKRRGRVVAPDRRAPDTSGYVPVWVVLLGERRPEPGRIPATNL